MCDQKNSTLFFLFLAKQVRKKGNIKMFVCCIMPKKREFMRAIYTDTNKQIHGFGCVWLYSFAVFPFSCNNNATATTTTTSKNEEDKKVRDKRLHNGGLISPGLAKVNLVNKPHQANNLFYTQRFFFYSFLWTLCCVCACCWKTNVCHRGPLRIKNRKHQNETKRMDETRVSECKRINQSMLWTK